MRTIVSPVRSTTESKSTTGGPNCGFLKFLPAVTTHASITFRHLPEADREEAIAESVAAAYVNYDSARRRGKSNVLKGSMLATYAVLHTRSGNHVGGSQESKRDALSVRAQKAGDFVVHRLRWDDAHVYDILKAPEGAWRLHLLEDGRTPIPEQVRFRVDFSGFMAGQQERTRKAIALLAAGHTRTEVADQLGVTPSAVTQRMNRVEQEWAAYEADAAHTAVRKKAFANSSRSESHPARASRSASEPRPAA